MQRHEFLVKSDFDPELQRLRVKMDEIEVQMEKTFKKAAMELDLEAGKTLKVNDYLVFSYALFRFWLFVFVLLWWLFQTPPIKYLILVSFFVNLS